MTVTVPMEFNVKVDPEIEATAALEDVYVQAPDDCEVGSVKETVF